MSSLIEGRLGQSMAIFALSLLIGLAWNQISPRGIPLVAPPLAASPPGQAEEYLPLPKATELWRGGAALFLDARDPEDYAAGHIGNALNLPAQSFAAHFGAVAPLLSPDSILVVYCDGLDCQLSHRLRDSLRELGHTNTHLLANGWTAWRQAGLPIAGKGVR